MGSFGIDGNVDTVTYNGYNMTPLYLRAVNNTNTPFAQQSPITAIGGPMYNYSNQNIYSQTQTSMTEDQTDYPQHSAYIPPSQNYNMQGTGN